MPIFTVSQISDYIKQLVENDELLLDLWITGEISNLRTSQAGHAYFTLKDDTNQLQCVMFKRTKGRDLLESGVSVSCHGRITFYEARGSVDFIGDIVMAEGLGLLAMEYERLKSQLENEGSFDISRKRTIPKFPKVIGVVTSSSGAVFHDICNVIQRRYPLAKVILASAQVQGANAPASICNAIDALNLDGRPDVIIIARGGGSQEELSAFNDESLARTIYKSNIPTVSAIGHETDFTIADYVADLRAPTPSAAAEITTPDGSALVTEIYLMMQQAYIRLSYKSAALTQQIQALVSKLEHNIPDITTIYRNVDDQCQRMDFSVSSKTALLKQQIISRTIHLEALSPKATLQRGYAIISTHNAREVVSSIKMLSPNQLLSISLSDGTVSTTVNDVIKNES